MIPKILVGCPTYNGKAYCLDKYAEIVKSLSYSNYDVLIVDNSPTGEYVDKIKSFGINVLKDEAKTGPHESIVHSRNIIKDYALQKGYDYFLSLEQDVIPPKDIIERLIRHDKKVVSAVYYTFYRFYGVPKLRPLIWAFVEGEPDKMRFMNSECRASFASKEPVLRKIKMCGLGCVLIHKSVLDKISFRIPENCSTYDDFAFCNDVRALGENIWADLSMQCDHLLERK